VREHGARGVMSCGFLEVAVGGMNERLLHPFGVPEGISCYPGRRKRGGAAFLALGYDV
jgi:hypothetical protein